MAVSRRFLWTPGAQPGDAFAITMPFDPKAVFGKARAPVIVTIGSHSYRSTIAHMGGPPFVPLRQSHREAAGVVIGRPVEIELELDEAVRTVEVPGDLAAAIEVLPGGAAAWEALSVTTRREHAEAIKGAKKAETRQKRIEKALDVVRAKAATLR